MPEYLVEKISAHNTEYATAGLNLRGGQGWRAVFFTPVNQDILVIYEKDDKAAKARAAKKTKKAQEAKKEKTTE